MIARSLLIAALLLTALGCKGGDDAQKAAVTIPTPTPTVAPTPTPAPTPVAVDLGDGISGERLAPGSGPEAAEGDLVTLKLETTSDDGKPLWSGDFEFLVGSGMGFPGLDKGVRGMKKGEVRRLNIPAPLGIPEKTEEGKTPGEPRAVKIEMELLNLKQNGAPQ
ncbi:hypothetical protein BH09SUM1_BH09SUM1_12990 [soil metagenome]